MPYLGSISHKIDTKTITTAMAAQAMEGLAAICKIVTTAMHGSGTMMEEEEETKNFNLVGASLILL